MMNQKNKAVSGLTSGIAHLFKKYKVWNWNDRAYNSLEKVKKGLIILLCDVIQVNSAPGFGTITGPNEVTVKSDDGKESTISTKNILIATGSDVASLPGLEVCYIPPSTPHEFAIVDKIVRRAAESDLFIF